MNFWLNFLGILSFVLLEGFFSGSETAIISCDRLRLKHLAKSGNKFAQLIEKFLSHPDRLLSTTLVGTNLSVIISSSLMTGLLVGKFGENLGPLLALLILTPTTLVFGEIIPKTIFRQYADFLSMIIVIPLIIFYYLLSPIIFSAVFITNVFLMVFKEKKFKPTTFLSKEEIVQFIEEKGKKEFFKEEKIEIIKKIFDFEGKTASSIMVPLEKVSLLEGTLKVQTILEEIKNYKYSRFPVYEKDRKNLIGFLEIKDLISASLSENINSFIKPLFVVPAEKKLKEIIEDFIAEKILIAQVVDEKGKTIGIITREDLIEELLGEIKDEFDK